MHLNNLNPNKSPQQTRVCVAMSGGVDSSAAAALLKQEGYNVFGLTMDLLQAPYLPNVSSVKDAAVVADKLGIEHHFIDLKNAFAEHVINYFTSDYLSGRTPSPCIKCNRHIKLGLLADKARELGADILVTGHYAETLISPNGVELHKSQNIKKDQSYFLFDIEKKNLEMLRCPLASLSKDQTREIAKNAGLTIFDKTDSQDICFVFDGKYAELIAKLKPEYKNISGNIVDSSGKILGQHKGLINYTVGQRKGLGIGGNIGILYVLKLDVPNNQLIVGPQEELKQNTVYINDVNWLGEEKPESIQVDVKLRSRSPAVPAVVNFLADNKAEVNIIGDFYGAAPGQGCCFYLDTRVLGGGFICK